MSNVCFIRTFEMNTATHQSAAEEHSSAETRRRVLEAAEQLFAVRGIEAVSIRDITHAAGVNLAAINYHFGTKQGLAAEVFKHCLGPLNAKRLELLDEVEAPGQRPDAETGGGPRSHDPSGGGARF